MKTTQEFILQTLRAGLAAGLLWSLAVPVRAQAPAGGQQDSKAVSVSKVERKNKAPVSKEILRVKLPKAVETTLPNGLTVLIMEDHRFPTVSVQLNISGAGPLYEPANLPGLANVTAQLLREGTKSRSSKQFAEEVDTLGATINANAGFGSAATLLTGQGLSDNLDQWFPLMVDMLLNPTFPAEEITKLKTRLKGSLRQQRSQSGFLANERFSKAVYGNHPAAVVTATAESLDAMTPESIAQWHGERYAPQNAILSIAGNVQAATLLPKLKEWLAAWKKSELKETLPPNAAPTATKKIFVVNRPNSVQTTLRMGNIAIDRRDPDYVPMVVLDRVFGAGPASRLFLNLREEKGYTYGVYSNFTALKYPGPWAAGGDLRTEVTEGAMTEFLKELNRIRNEKVPDTELDDARRSEVAKFALSLESPTQLLQYETIRKLYGFPADYWDTYPAKIMAVSADDILRVGRKYINADTMQVVAVGDGSKITAVMEKFGPVEVFDTEGKPVAKPATTGASNQK